MKNKLLIILLTLIFFSCKTNDNRNISVSYNETADGWLKKPSNNEFYYSEQINIPIIFVKDDKFNDAISILEETFYKKLTNEEYTYFTGTQNEWDNNAFLIRSINYSFNENSYRIYISNENNLLISHSVLSSGKRKGIQKWPIIIIYKDFEKINKIYTNYSVVK